MNSKLGAYIAPYHDPEKWRNYLKAIHPNWVRILMPGADSTGAVSDVYKHAMGSDISLRWWDLDDGGEGNKWSKFEDPVASAKADVRDMVKRVESMEAQAAREGLPFPSRDFIWFNTPNEPPIQNLEMRDAIALNAATIVREAAKFGFGTMALEISVGNPHEWPPVWGWAKVVFDALRETDGVLALHEYWQPEGPHHVWTDHEGKERVDWGALAGRYLHLDYDGPIVITEAGVDGRIFNRFATPDTGYLKFMDAHKYAAQMKEYLREVREDSRIESVLPFITDVPDKEWESFNTLYAQDAFVTMLGELANEKQPIPTTDNTTVFVPSVHKPVVVDTGDPVVPHVAAGVVDPFVARSIFGVESGGKGFNDDGTLKIRFEAHIFKRYVPKNRYEAHFRYDEGDYLNAYYRQSIHHSWIPYHNSQKLEWEALTLAATLDQEAAYLSTSFGAAQIMGFNHARVGFPSASAMATAFARDFNYHIIAFFNYVLSDSTLLEAIRTKNWREIARLYNGSGLVDLYSARLEAEYKRIVEAFNG